MRLNMRRTARSLAALVALTLLPALPLEAAIDAPPTALPNLGLGGIYGVVPSGALCDVQQVEDNGSGSLHATGASGQQTVTFSGGSAPSFTSADVGKYATLSGAGAAGGVFTSTITGVSGSQVTFAVNLSTSLSGTAVAFSWGHADDSAIAAAITAAGTGGGTVFVPGVCGLISTVALPNLGGFNLGTGSIIIAGAGANRSRLVMLAAPAGGAVLQEPTAWHKDVGLRDLTIDANGLASYGYDMQGGTGGRGYGDLVVQNATQAEIRLGDGTHNAQNFTLTGGSLLKDPLVMSGVSAPYNLLFNGTDNQIIGTVAVNGSSGSSTANFRDTGSGNNRLIGTHGYGPAAYAYWFNSETSCVQCEVDGATVAGIRLDGPGNNVIGGRMFFNNQSTSGVYGIDLASGTQAGTRNDIDGITIDNLPPVQFVETAVSPVFASIRITNLPPAWPAGQLQSLLAKTTDGSTAVEMTIDMGAATAYNVPALANWDGVAVDGVLVARDGSTGGTAAWKVSFSIHQNGNAASTALVGSATVTAIGDVTAMSNAPTVTADTTNGAFSLNVTGNTGHTVYWRYTYTSTTTY